MLIYGCIGPGDPGVLRAFLPISEAGLFVEAAEIG